MAGRAGRRAAAEKGTANLRHLQQLQLKFNSDGQLKAIMSPKAFRISDCADLWDNYGTGSILRIQMINFQKYSDCIVRPGPYMNMIIGPNGTGKSTIVAAIALGLGASPAVIGRSNRPIDFIKYDQTQATIEIILKCGGNEAGPLNTRNGFVTIKRVMRRVDEFECKSDWYINGNTVSQKQVVQCVEELGAQISNLCQFLPQDKVSEFAQMSPEQMLIATMRAAASEETNTQFTQLVQFKKQEREYNENLKIARLELATKQRVMASLQVSKTRAQERDDRRKRIENMKRKRPWLHYQFARKQFMDLKADRDRLRAELEAAVIETNQELTDQISSLEKSLKTSTRNIQRSLEGLKKARVVLEKGLSQVSRMGTLIESKKREILQDRASNERIRVQCDKDRQSLAETETEIKKSTQASSINDLDSIEHEIRQLRKEISLNEQKMADFSSEELRIQTESKLLCELESKLRARLEAVNNIRSRRLEALSRMYPAIPRVLDWLEANRSNFRGRVVGPIALDLQIKDEKMAQATESVLSKSLMASFVFENTQDHDFFSRICTERDWRVNSSILTNYSDDQALPTCQWSKKDLKKLGFDGILTDIIDAPKMVLWALCEANKVHLIPFANGPNSSIDLQGCESLRGLTKFLTNESFYELKRSRYNESDIATRISPFKSAFILVQESGDSDTSSEIPNIQSKIDSIRRQIAQQQEKMRQILEKNNSIIISRERFNGELEQKEDLRRAALVKLAALRKLEHARERLRKDIKNAVSALNNNSFEQEALQELTNLIESRTELLSGLSVYLFAYHEALKKCTQEDREHKSMLTQLAELESLRNLQQDKHSNLRRQVEEAESEMALSKERAQEALLVAEMNEITDELKEAFALMTDDLNTLTEQIRTEEALLNASGSGGDRFGSDDQQKLEETTQQIRELEAKIADSDGGVQRIKDQMSQISSSWRESVNEMISRINEKFQNFFSKISCKGSVILGVPTEDETDFDRYTLVILVSFRDNELLQRLTGHRQSGGEKSVSTILYLLSLQELSRAPFRVVDEINQGMDVQNERKVHALMVETATASAASSQSAQYFLITPKLLTGLEYNDKMNVLCIFNGPGVQ